VFEAEWFDTEYIVIGRTYAKSAGIVSEREVQLFFKALEGRLNVDLYYTSNGTLVEWSNVWNTIDNIKSHFIFRVMPIDCVPAAILSERLKQYEAMPPKPIASSEISGDWFKQHTQRRTEENDFDFEYRLVKTLVAVFRAIKKT
jgi:hypothetical protein